jgi:hypothetical protein
MNRAPIFELHIRPMFRTLDRLHMQRVNAALDLWDYDSVRASAAAITGRTGGAAPSMPTAEVGGGWPDEWVALFARWSATGFRRLSLGAGKAGYQLNAAGAGFQLAAKVDVPNSPDGDSAAWFDIVSTTPGAATYRLVVFPGEATPPAADTIEIDVTERIDAATAAGGVTVIDANGAHAVHA